MKCLSCDYESKEDNPKFCPECGTRFLISIPSTGTQAVKTVTTSISEGERRNLPSLTAPGTGKELIAGVDETSATNDQAEANRNESKEEIKSTDSVPTASLTSLNTKDSSIVWIGEEDIKRDGSITIEHSQTSQQMTKDLTSLPDEGCCTKSVPQNEDNSAVTTHTYDLNAKHEIGEDKDAEEASTSQEQSDFTTRQAKEESKHSISTQINTGTDSTEMNHELANKNQSLPTNAPARQGEERKPSSQQKVADNVGNQAAMRESVTVYFHVIVSKNFNVNRGYDSVVVKAEKMKDYQGWSQVFCDMHYVQEIKDLGFLYEGQTYVSKDNLDTPIPYKYVIVRAHGVEDYEYIYNVDVQDTSHVNRCLLIYSKFISFNEWHQYDDVCMKENHGLLQGLKNRLRDRYRSLCDDKMVAGEVMLKSIFSILSDCNERNLSIFFFQLRQFNLVYMEPKLFCHSMIEWTSLGFGTNQVHNLILRLLNNVCEPFLDKRSLTESDIKSKLIAGLVCIRVVNIYSIGVEKKRLVSFCKVLNLAKKHRESMMVELQKAKTIFSAYPQMHHYLRAFCQSCIDSDVDEWVLVLPILHAFSTSHLESSYAGTTDQEDIWAGLEGLAYEKVKKYGSNLLPMMTRNKHLLEVDPKLIQSWLCLIPTDHMHKYLEEFSVTVTDALKACRFKFAGVEIDQRKSVEDILRKLLQSVEDSGRYANEQEFNLCCQASLDLYNTICCNPLLKTNYHFLALSVKIILTLLHQSGALHHQADDSEDNSQLHGLHVVWQQTLFYTRKWLEDVYGHKFIFYEDRRPVFSLEVMMWGHIIKAGEEVTPKWKDALIQMLLRKIKQEEPIQQISIYCKEKYQIKGLHPCIQKCFEDCAIDAVPFAYQKDPNILGYINHYNYTVENFSRFISSVVENSWPRDDKANFIKDRDRVLEHLLNWTDATNMFRLYGANNKILSGIGKCIKEVIILSESVFMEAVRNVFSGDVRFKQMETILAQKEQFLNICELKRGPNLLLIDVMKVLNWRKEELNTLQIEQDKVDSLLKMIQSIDPYVKVNVSEIQLKRLDDLGDKKMNAILPVKTLDTRESKASFRYYDNLSPDLMMMANMLDTFKNSHIFITCWERQAQTFAQNSQKESSQNNDADGLEKDEEEYTLEEMYQEVFKPCVKNCKRIYKDLRSGQVTFEVLDYFLSVFRDNYKKLEKECRLLCHLGSTYNDTWISDFVNQMKQYHQLNVSFHSAKLINELRHFFKLTGDFQILETLLQFADDFENYKTRPLSSISKDVVKTSKYLSTFKEDNVECLQEVLLRKEFILWVKEALEDVNDLKVFVDLASISAGENDMDVDRVACFHDAVLGYSPLLYELKPDFGSDKFMECLGKLWKTLNSDKNLPKKLRDSARHLAWLKTVRESHGSVELSSLSLAAAMNKNGVYEIKAPNDNKKVTLDRVLQLQLPMSEGFKDVHCYTLEELRELLNKLMLLSGIGDQGNSEVITFSEIFSNVQRLACSFIDLYLAGNILFRYWEAKIYCSVNVRVSVVMNFNGDEISLKDLEIEGQGGLSNLLPDISKTMEGFLEQWLAFVNKKRSQHYFLNYYTAEQLVFLCQQYQKRDISQEALVMLSFIKPVPSNIDIINSAYLIDSSDALPSGKPDMMEFHEQFHECETVMKKLELVWMFSMENTSSLFPEWMDIDTLGRSLAALADLNQETVVRDLHPSLQPGRPNLILSPPSDILSCAVAVYMHSPNQPLPSHDEVLLCTPHTTFEEVSLFLHRCLTPCYSGKKIYSLIYADQLSYDVGYKSEQLFQQLLAQGLDSYNFVIICNSDREHCYIPSVFSQYKIHVIQQMPLEDIRRYISGHFKVDSKDSAASVFKNGMSAGIVASKRAGVGKSLYIKRLYQKLQHQIPNKKPLLKIIRLIKPEVEENQVVGALLPFLNIKGCPVIFHIDITSSVSSGISEFLFKLLILQYLTNSEGRMWKRQPNHLYLIEILDSSDMLFSTQFNSALQMAQTFFIDFFPKISCWSPKEVLTKSTEDDITDCGDPGMDNQEFQSEYFQRPYQYLKRFDEKQDLDTFTYKDGYVEGDPARCLQIFLLYCGIVDPSWSELRNFAWFLNVQLKDCESSVFCNPEHVGDTLEGFKTFVVHFMIFMAKDFATPSLNIADQCPGRQGISLAGAQEQDLVPFLLRKKWESEPHPYIFFNNDHQSMTFIGFHLQPNTNGGIDAINPTNKSIIKQNIMSRNLYRGLILQKVQFNVDFNALHRDEKITILCMVLGIQWPTDPDETYELTMDNVLKMLAIKMRFRCGIPVVLMGETGCGKTRLIKFLCHLCKGSVETENLKLVKVHGGTTAETIYQKIVEAQDAAQINTKENVETVLFFDEANTTESINSIKEVLCDHTVNGVSLNENSGLQIIAACNPYRMHTNEMIRRLESAGLGYRVKSDETKERLGTIPLRQLVYRVHALPPSMMPLVWDFGQLNNETEKQYIQQIVQRLVKEIHLPADNIHLITNVLSASQSYMRRKKNECSFVSLRDVERCIEVFKWFYIHHDKLLKHLTSMLKDKSEAHTVKDKVAWSLVLAVGVCYHASLENKAPYRKAICKFFPPPLKNQQEILNEITIIQDLFLEGVQLRDTIAKNLALKENLFMMVICIELKIPLFLVGKPGSSKSLAKTIVADAMQGQAAHTDLYKDLKQIHLVSFQCSPHSTPEGIIGTFKHCARFQEGKNLNEYVSVVVLDEIGLAEDSPKMPLKTLHPLLEDGCIDDDLSPHKKVGFIGISNWALDPAKMNRGIFVSREDPSEKELVDSAKGICCHENQVLNQHFPNLAKGYSKVMQKQPKKEFFGLRDFYSLIKMVFVSSKKSSHFLALDDIARAVVRNFSGKDDMNALDFFLKDEKKYIAEISTIDLVMENIKSDIDDCRYLLILTKNYAALQIVLQQGFLDGDQQPEIIFGSGFPKDQEYTQICRNINRVKICMETGRTVILLNLQLLYESLYDALNQYYVYLAGQKYVDLGLGTHRVKCRVHPKFRLIVIEEKEVVYRDFPIPLINRLEKHYLDINTYLKSENKFLVEELEKWVKEFTKANTDYVMGKKYKYEPSDVFVGYHSDTCASVVLQVTGNLNQTEPNREDKTDVKEKAETVLLNCATPDSVIRLGRKEYIDVYFKKQKHGSLLEFLIDHVTSGNPNTMFTEITTFSRLLTSADKKILEAELQKQVNSIEIVSLQQFDTEFSFLKKIRSFLETSSGNVILIIQTDFEEVSQGADLVASAKYSTVNELNKMNIRKASVFVCFITKLPRMQGEKTYVGFRGGLWQSIHIDDLRTSKDMVTDLTALQKRPISQLFYTHERRGEIKVDSERGSEDQAMDTGSAVNKSEDMLDTTILIRSCVQNAISLLRDDENVNSRSTKRIEILITLLSSKDEIMGAFIRILKLRLHNMLKMQEDVPYYAEEWVVREAANQEALHEAGTFRQTLWKRVQRAVTPLLSQVLSVLDRNANLDVLVNKHIGENVKSFWMHMFQDESILPMSNNQCSSQTETILVKNYMNISAFRENSLPFSWRIKDYLEDILTQAKHIDSIEGSEMKFLDIFLQTPLGQYISSLEENDQEQLFLFYKRDFILMTMNILSSEELQMMEFALSACIEELIKNHKRQNGLPLPWVHIGYNTFQHRLQNLSRILLINPSVLGSLTEKIADPRPTVRNEMVLDIYAAIACLETLKHSVQKSDLQTWTQQVKNIQVPIELICSEGYLQDYSPWCKTGIKQIRRHWNSIFAMALFMEHLLVEENLKDANMMGIVRGHTIFLGKRLENFEDIRSERPLNLVIDVIQMSRDEVGKFVSSFGMQVCAICDEDPTEPICLHCNHIFCQSCMNQWLATKKRTCPTCQMQISESFTIAVSADIRDAIQKYVCFKRQCNSFFVDFICNLCFKDNTPPDQKVIHNLLSFLFGNTESGSYTRALSPFDDAVDKTPVVRSVLLKLLLKYSFNDIMGYVQEYLNKVENSHILKQEDTKEVYLLFINCLEDSLFEQKQKNQSEEEKNEYLQNEIIFLKEYLQSCQQQTQDEKSVQFFQDVARVRLALDTAAEMLSAKAREIKNDEFLDCVKTLCFQSGNDWYRTYIIRKLANLDGIDNVQSLVKDSEFEWLFSWGKTDNTDAETSHIDPFLVYGQGYKILRDGIGRAMIECKKECIEAAIQACNSQNKELAVHFLLAVFREITLHNGARNTAQQGTAPEQEPVKAFIKGCQIFKTGSLNQFVQALLNNNRPVLKAVPDLTGSQINSFGLVVHMAAILLSSNNRLCVPLKNLSFSPAKMQNSFLPTMPEDMFTHAKGVINEPLHWYLCPNGHYCAIGECGLPMQLGRCLDCGSNIGGEAHVPLKGFQRIQNDIDRTKTGHVLGSPECQGPAVAPDRNIPAPAFILLRLITHMALLLGSEEDSQTLGQIVNPPVQDVSGFFLGHIEKDLEYLKNILGKSADDTTTVVHLVLSQMMDPQLTGQWPANYDDVWSNKATRNNWEKYFVSTVISPVLKSLDRNLATINNYISQDERISSNPIVKVIYGDPLISAQEMDLPRDSNVHCSKIWSCRQRISIDYLLHIVQQQDGKDDLSLLTKFLEKDSELQLVKFLPDILKLQKDLVNKFQNYKDISFKTISDFLQNLPSGGIKNHFEQRIKKYILVWNQLRFSLQTNGEIKLQEDMCDDVLNLDSDFEFLLPRRQGLGLAATAVTSYLIALHNNFIYALGKHTNTEQKYTIKASEVMDIHVISYEMERDIVPIVLSNCQYNLESGKETLQEFDFLKIQHQIITHLFQGKPRITILGLPTLTLSHDRNYENLFTDLKRRLPQDNLSNSAIDVIGKDLNAFSDVCEALYIVDISLGFLATSGGHPDLCLTKYIEDVLRMGEQSSAHVLDALKRCQLKHSIALWQLLTALKSQHLLQLKRDPFSKVDKAYKMKLDKNNRHSLSVFLEQNGTKLLFLELHEFITLKLQKPKSTEQFPHIWILKDTMIPILESKYISSPELENDFPEKILLAHCIEAWKVVASTKQHRI